MFMVHNNNNNTNQKLVSVISFHFFCAVAIIFTNTHFFSSCVSLLDFYTFRLLYAEMMMMTTTTMSERKQKYCSLKSPLTYCRKLPRAKNIQSSDRDVCCWFISSLYSTNLIISSSSVFLSYLHMHQLCCWE